MSLSPQMDFEGLARILVAQSRDLLPQWFPAGRFLGREFVIGDLSGTPGESLSVNTNTGQWSDFSTDDRGGDLISLYAAAHRLRQIDAAKRLTDMMGGGAPLDAKIQRTAKITPMKTPESPEWSGIFPIPHDAPRPPTHHPTHGKPAHIAKYRDRDGHIIALVYRCEPEGGRKQVVPLTFCERADGRKEWRWQSLPKARSLYRADLLDQHPDARVLLVEGEPKCDAANRILGDDVIAMSWANGSKSWKHADWPMLAGRDVIIWPDADAAGLDAAHQIAEQLPHHGATVRVLAPPVGVADGWDIGDAIKEKWDATRIMQFLDAVPPVAAAPVAAPPAPPKKTSRPAIQVQAGLLDETATEAETALIESGMPIYQRGQSLVRPVRSEVPASRGRMTVAAGLAPINQSAMVDRLCQAATWERFDGRSKEWRRIDPPTPVATTILSRVGDWRFPPVAGVITTPTMRPDGSLLTAPGYDAATRLYHIVDDGIDLSKHVPAKPTRADAEKALADLLHLLQNFPTVCETDVSVALSGIISPVVRGALGVVPMHAFRASTAGTGKSYLADVISSVSTSRPCPVVSVAQSEEETEKRIAALLLSAFPIICLDNVNGELGGDLLCQAIERPIVQIRPLGSSDIIEIESRSCIIATGNALRVRGDMTRRTLLCNLDAGVERPELRAFDFDPLEEVQGDRGRYVGAAITIVMAYAAAGSPDKVRALGSFREWSDTVRSALMWLGCADPCASMEEAREDDPELSELTELLSAWRDEFGTIGAFTTSDLIEKISVRLPPQNEHDREGPYEFPTMREVILRIATGRNGPDSRKLATVLRAKEGRIAQGLRLRKAGKAHGNIVTWQVGSV